MKRFMSGGLVLAALCVAAPGMAQTRAKAQNVPEIPMESVPNFLKMPPDLYLGESMGVARNSKGHVFVYTRRDDTRLLEFDPEGTFVKEWGEGLYGFEFAHKVRVDKDDNVWVVDEGSNMVIKFNPEGRVVMVLGRRPEAVEGAVETPQGEPPPAQRYIFGRPTDVGWDAQGNIFVTDGYINHRLVKYDKNGRYIREVGSHLAGRDPYQFNTPHGLAVDAQGNVYVADRGNARIQVFDNNLVLRAIYDNVGNPWEVHLTRRTPVPLLVEFQSRCQSRGVVGNERRDLQDGTRRTDRRQVWAGRQGAGPVPDRPRDRLPQPRRAHRVGDCGVARAEDPPAPNNDDIEPVGRTHETPVLDCSCVGGVGRWRHAFSPTQLPGDSLRGDRTAPPSSERAPRGGRRRGDQFEG